MFSLNSSSRLCFLVWLFMSAASSAEKLQIRLPGMVSEAVVAGEGKYLLMKIEGVRTVSVLDVQRRKLVKQLPLPSVDTLIAGGAHHIILVQPGQRIIQRIRIKDWKLELTQTLDWGARVTRIAMGSASYGPLMVAAAGGHITEGSFRLVDVQTLRSIETGATMGRNFEAGRGPLRVSADGRVFGCTRYSVSPTGLYVLRYDEGKIESRYEHTSAGTVIPGHDGQTIYAGGRRFSFALRPFSDTSKRVHWLPAADSAWTFRFKNDSHYHFSNDSKPNTTGTGKINLIPPGLTQPHVELSDVPISHGSRGFELDRRMHLFTRAGCIVSIRNDAQLDITTFDLIEELTKTGQDFLFINSTPNRFAEAGKRYAYDVDVRSSKPEKLSLEAGPAGMKLNEATLSWDVPDNAGSAEYAVILRVSASDQEIFHSFRIKLRGTSRGGKKLETIVAAPNSKTSDTRKTITEEGIDIRLPGSIGAIALAALGEIVALHLPELRQVALVNVKQGIIRRFVTVPSGAVRLSGSVDKLFVLSLKENLVQRFDLDSGKREINVLCPTSEPGVDLLCGCFAKGPLCIVASSSSKVDPWSSDRNRLFVFDSLSLTPIKSAPNDAPVGRAVIAPNGQVVATNVNGIRIYRLDQPFRKPDQTVGSTGGHGHVLPNYDGSLIFTAAGVRSSRGVPLYAERRNAKWSIPGITGKLYLTFKGDPHPHSAPKDLTLNVVSHDDNRQLAKIEDLPPIHTSVFNEQPGGLQLHERVFFSPHLSIVGVVPRSDNLLHLRRFDLLESLKASNVDYLLVDSVPPNTIQLGQRLAYKVNVLSKRGGVKMVLSNAPDGVRLTGDTIKWTVPESLAASNLTPIMLEISDDSGQRIFHTFSLSLPPNEPVLNSKTRIQSSLKGPDRIGINPLAKQELPQGPTKLRMWTDRSGRHRVRAKLIRVIGRATVVLKTEEGEIVRVKLSQLRSSDIYFAVEYDLKSKSKHAD